MTIIEAFSRIEHKIRPLWAKLPPGLATRIFTTGRKLFLQGFYADLPLEQIILSEDLNIKLWDIDFGNCLFNAAGIFKKGEGYELCAKQGAGAYLAGTTTAFPRNGNFKNGIRHPVASYTKSGIATNWMGLPNEGHEVVANRISEIRKIKFCPIGISIAAAPEQKGLDALNGLLMGFNVYNTAGVDFIELNESCPNVIHEHSVIQINSLDKSLINRLEYISSNFLNKRKRKLPVIVKFSADTNIEQVPALLDILITLKFDGVNFGNTSTTYNEYKDDIDKSELSLYKYFTKKFGGGVSGRVLKHKSYLLASSAANYIKMRNLRSEFHVIRTGGIENSDDIILSNKSGIALNQWFTGYFDSFAKYGHKVYRDVFEKLVAKY